MRYVAGCLLFLAGCTADTIDAATSPPMDAGAEQAGDAAGDDAADAPPDLYEPEADAAPAGYLGDACDGNDPNACAPLRQQALDGFGSNHAPQVLCQADPLGVYRCAAACWSATDSFVTDPSYDAWCQALGGTCTGGVPECHATSK